MVRGGSGLCDPKQFADYRKQIILKIPALVCVDLKGSPKSCNEHLHKLFSSRFTGLLCYTKGLSPFCKLISYYQDIIIVIQTCRERSKKVQVQIVEGSTAYMT